MRPTVNPYRRLIGSILEAWPDAKSRFLWDLNPVARESSKRIESWHNKYAGQKAVIVCNGPSLNNTDLSLLKGVFTFGLNKINLLFNRSDFRPDCIVAVNPFVIEQNQDFFNQTDLPIFIDSVGHEQIKFRKNVAFLHSVYQRKFAKDCSMSINQGATVTYVAIQLAYHMGFKDVALIGCDHSFADKGPANKTVTSSNHDANHFDPNYFAGGVQWQLPDLLESEVSYTLARDTFDNSGRRLVNATVGGRLDIFERMSLEDFMK